MYNTTLPRRARTLCKTMPLAGVILLAGCQSYQPAPLDLGQLESEVASRLVDDESLRAFADRFASTGKIQPAPFDTGDGINAAEAEVIALFYNPDLRLARMRAGVAMANVETAGLWEDPVFGFDGAELLSPSGPFEYGLTLSLTIPISGRLGVEEDKADRAYEAELRRVVDAEWSMRAKVRKAWADWSVAAERMRLIDEVAEQIDRIGVVSDRLEKAGELTRVEARLLRSQRIGLRVERTSVEAEAEQSRLELMSLMGLLPTMRVELVPALPRIDLPESSQTTDRLVKSNTTLAVARADYAVAEQSLRLEVRKQYPDIEIGAGYGSEDKDDRLLLGVSLPIPSLNANRSGIATARAERQLARSIAQTEFERLAFQLAGAQARLLAAQKQQEVLQDELVPMLDAQAAEIDRLAELGEVNTLILLETVTRRFEAKGRILDLNLAELAARNEVARLLGPNEPATPSPVSASEKTKTTMTGSDDAAEGVSR